MMKGKKEERKENFWPKTDSNLKMWSDIVVTEI